MIFQEIQIIHKLLVKDVLLVLFVCFKKAKNKKKKRNSRTPTVPLFRNAENAKTAGRFALAESLAHFDETYALAELKETTKGWTFSLADLY